MSTLVIRASRAPLAFACPGSLQAPALPVSEESLPARLGNAVHAALVGLVERGAIDWDRIPDVAARWNVDADEVRMLCGLANKQWQSLSASFPHAMAEVPLVAGRVGPAGLMYQLEGHADILSTSADVGRIGDWKTGRFDSSYAQQMRAYAALLLLEDPDLREATATVIWIRDGEVENYTMTREKLGAWLDELEARVLAWDGVFHPGSHCGFCPRSHECEAATAYARRDVAVISDKLTVARAEAELATMTPAEILDLHRKAVLVQGYAERVRAAIKEHVLSQGPIVFGGARLEIASKATRELDPIKAWATLEAMGFGDTDFAECMDMRISRVEKRVAQKAGRGNGAAAVRTLTQKLDEAGAVTVKETHWLTEKRA